jgi:serine protease Do
MKMHTRKTFTAMLLVLVLALTGIAFAENAPKGVEGDNNPAIAVAKATQNSVVGVITYSTSWSRQGGDQKNMLGQGSGVVIDESGHVITNWHVVEDGNTYQVLLPSGEHADATLTGYDESTDLAVLKVESDELSPVEIGSSCDLVVGNSVFAIGNPGGSVLANTMTSGIVSALERTSVNAANTTRTIAYIQHDAPINSGNSGGGLFDVNGRLIGINTLKYAGSAFSSVSFEGLGFAIPVDTVYPIAMDLIEHGKVQRPALGVTVSAQEGPDDARRDYPPASLCVYSVTEDGPAAKAGVEPYDFITHINDVRVTTLAELTGELDKHNPGDTVTLTIVRYDSARAYAGRGSKNSGNENYGDEYGNYGRNYGGNYGGNYDGNYGYNPFGPFGGFFGYGNDFFNNPYNYNYGNSNAPSVPPLSGNFETITVDVVLEIVN